jgi:YVTN family beta-propeller protein
MGIGVNSQINRIYVADNDNPYDSVYVIDGAGDSLIATIGVGINPWAVGVNPTTNKIYVTNSGSDNVSVIDGSTNSVIATVWVGNYPIAIDVNPLSNRIYVANNSDDSVSVIDGEGDTVITTIKVGSMPTGVAVDQGTNRIYVLNHGQSNVYVIDGTSNSVVDSLAVCSWTEDVAVNLQTSHIYVSCPLEGTIWELSYQPTGVEESFGNPQALNLNINPNPFNKITQLVLDIPSDSKGKNIDFSIYDISGRLVKTFSNMSTSSSQVIIQWDGTGNSGKVLSSGSYFGVLRIGEKETSKKIIMIK